MSRPLRLAAGAAVIVVAVRGARGITHRYVPAAARGALGAAARLAGTGQRVAAEFRAGRAEREAELRADLLAGADLSRARAHVDAWRAGRAEQSGTGDAAPDAADGAWTGVGEPGRDAGRPRPASAPGAPRAGSAAAAGASRAGSAAAIGASARGTRRGRGGSHRAEDGDDGPLGYSFF